MALEHPNGITPEMLSEIASKLIQAQQSTAIATLAAAIIQAQGGKTVSDYIEAVSDARNILMPERTSGYYKDWQARKGVGGRG